MIKLFTDIDLDGVGCAILAKMVFNADITFVGPKNINEHIKNYVENQKYKEFEYTYITDLSVNEEIAEMINNSEMQNRCLLLDHHKTAKWLNKYSWSFVEIENQRGRTSGTSLFYDYLTETMSLAETHLLDFVDEFVELVRKYDTWQWKDDNDPVPKMWNDLLWIYGRDKFIETTIEKIKSKRIVFTEIEEIILQYKQKEINKDIKVKGNEIRYLEFLGYKIGVVFAERFVSELGNDLCELHPEIDFIAIIDIGSAQISYRTVKNNIDVSSIAEIFGGGGHNKAAGNPIEGNLIVDFVNTVFKQN